MRILLFTGKGGVGKTTLAAATAARVAAGGGKVLVVSTDPAHSLGDALDAPLGGEPSEVVLPGDGPTPPRLHAAEVHLRSLVDESWIGLRDHLRTVLRGSGVADLDAAELTALPGIEELLCLVEVQRLAESGTWDTVIVDCGPTAETLRLLALPESLSTYLERLFPTHRRVVRGVLAGLAGSDNVERWDAVADALSRIAEKLTGLREMLVAPGTSVRLVLTPESVVAAETRRTLTALALQQIRVDGLVANRVVPDPGSARGAAAAWLRARRDEQRAVLEQIRTLSEAGLRTVAHRPSEPVGPAALLELGAELYDGIDPLDGPPSAPMMSVSAAEDGAYVLRVSLPLHENAELDLARVDDELAITVDGRRRLVALPAVLRRCQVAGAMAGDDGLAVSFRPDPDLWMR